MDRPARESGPSERTDIRSFFIKWHFFAPFFAGVLGLLAAFVFLFLTSTGYLFDFYKQRQSRETLAAVRDAMAKRQQFLESYLAFIRDDADFKNAFYYAGEDMISLKKPLAEYLRKYKPLLGWDFIEAIAPDGRVIHSEMAAESHARRIRLDPTHRPTKEIATRLVMIDDTPHLVAAIPVRQFNRLAGHLVVGFDFGPSLLKELHEVTRHDFFLLDAAGAMVVSTIQGPPLRQTLLKALATQKTLPMEISEQGRRYFLSELPMPNSDSKAAPIRLYVVNDMSDLEAFRRRIIMNALVLFAFIGAVGFLVSYLSSRALSGKVNKVLSEMQEYRAKVESQKKLAALVELAGQISHDIRSPLAALDSVTGNVAHLPEEQRLIIRSAVGRIRDIANQLLASGRPATETTGEPMRDLPPAPDANVYLLSSLIDPIITEKRLEFRSKLGIEIDAHLDVASYGHFAEVEPAEFKRVLSNLISNGVEALPGKGMVTVSLGRAGEMIELKVEDNGKGIPPELRSRLGERGETFGKPGGSGLGLYHAKTSAAAWGGSLEISSEVGAGTTVEVKLPAARPPAWFVSQLELPSDGPVVVLDDDPTIHQIWQGRFESHPSREAGVEVVHCSRAEELRRWMAANPRRAETAVFLLDYELRGEEQTGLTLAKALSLGDRAILVTSRFEDKTILEECVRLGVRLIPKGLAGFVPIACALPVQPDAVLIDDDHLVHANWKVAARTNGKILDAFSTPGEFLAVIGRLDKKTPIYLDSKLADGVRGEEFAKELHAQGFRNLYLATGQQRNVLPPMPWIKEIVGKKSPWSQSAQKEASNAI